MPLRVRLVRLIALLLPLAFPAWAAADPIQLLSSDEKGVTLHLDLPAPQLGAPDPAGRVLVDIPGLGREGDPGRAALPLASTLIALPPGARAVARVVDGGVEDVRSAVSLRIVGKPGFHDGGGSFGLVPDVTEVPAILDGPWPTSPVELGEPFTLRHVRMVALRMRPVRWDAATHTLWSRRSLTVRVDFVGAGAVRGVPMSEDRHWDSVLERALINFDVAKRWRPGLRSATESGLRLLESQRAPTRSSAAPRAATEQRLTVAAFDEDNPEVRVLLDSTGVYSLSYTNLSAAGFPAAVPINELSVHRHEFVAGGNPPYVTFELPIEVDDNNHDGVFNASDRIVLWVQNWAQRSHASIAQRLWGDGEVVYVTSLPGRNGLRLPARSGWQGPDVSPRSSYRFTSHYEEAFFYVPTFQLGGFGGIAESDTNTDQFLRTNTGTYDRNSPGFSDIYPFETNDLDAGRPVKVTVQWVGNSRADHITWADIRNGSNQYTTAIDSAYWSGRNTFTSSGSIPGTAVTEGLKNALRWWGRDVDNGAIVNAGFNWFEVEYARRYKALRGMLRCTSDSAAGLFQINATGFNSRNVRVYDVTDSIAPVRLTLPDSVISSAPAPYTVRFQDQNGGAALRRYVVFDTPKPAPVTAMTAVTRRSLTQQPQADYLLIAPEAFLPAAQALAAHRQSQGLRVLVSPLEAVQDEFNGGRKSSYAIRRYLQFADTTWGARFVMLMGDGSQDPQNLLGSAGPDFVPVQVIGGPVLILDSVSEAVPSDTWFSWCLSCSGAPSGPMVPDMFLGRLPVQSLAQAQAVVDKIIAYDQVSPSDTWRRRMLIVADDQFSTESGGGVGGTLDDYCFKDGEESFIDISRRLHDVITNEAGLGESDPELFDLAVYLSGEGAPNGCRPSIQDTRDHTHTTVTPQMFQKLNEGRLWFNFEGHANPYVLTHEDLYVNRGLSDDLALWSNPGKLTLFSAFSCHANAFATVREGDSSFGPSLGEEMVTLPDKGAVASWASPAYEVIAGSSINHLSEQFARALFADPPRDPYLGMGGARAILGESIALAFVRNVAEKGSFSYEGQAGITYCLLGDPGTRISIGAPQALVTANSSPVTSGQPVRLHTVGDNLRLDADLVSNVKLTSIVLRRTFAGATTTIPATDYVVTPAFPDSGDASKGGRRYHVTYLTSLPPDNVTFTFDTQDRYGVPRTFDAVFQFQTVLRAEGAPIGNNEVIARNAQLTLSVLSPAPLVLPNNLTLTLNGNPMPYTFVAANGDTTGREWLLTLPHSDFANGTYTLQVSAAGGATTTHVFQVTAGGDRVSISNALAFPNPFDDQVGTYFSFQLGGPAAADVQIRVYTVTGRLVYKRTDRGVTPCAGPPRWRRRRSPAPRR